MKATYRVLGYLIAALVVVQAAVIALGVFGLGTWVENGHDLTKSVMDSDSSSTFSGAIGFGLHAMIGMILIPLVSLVLLIVSFFAKVPGGVKWALFVLLDVVLQIVLAVAAHSVYVLGLLHGINAFVVAGLASAAAARATRPVTTATEGAAAAQPV